MTNSSNHQNRVAIIGGGISGLAAAYYLQRSMPQCDYTVFEAQAAWGGVLQTKRQDGFLIERSADSFLDTAEQPWAGQLVRELGMEAALISTDARFRKARVLHAGQLHDIPAGFQLMAPAKVGPILGSRLLSWRGKARLIGERFVPPTPDDHEETLAQFARRRVGQEAFERLVQPLVSGIYTADPDKLCMQAALPRFPEWERRYGSLTAGLRAQTKTRHQSPADTSGARYAAFRSLRDGMESLVAGLVAKLRPASLRLETPVEALSAAAGGWRVTLENERESQYFQAVILATPPHVAARIVAPADVHLQALLDGIYSASVAIVSLGVKKSQLAKPLNYFGVVIPLIERRDIIAASFSSVKFADRAPADQELIRVFIGGDCHHDLLQNDDRALCDIACRELREILGLSGDPVVLDIARWHQRTPQYHLGHRLRCASIRDQLDQLTGLEIAGNALHGIGVPHCIRSGQQAAERVVACLRGAGR